MVAAISTVVAVLVGSTFVVETAFLLLYQARKSLEAGVLPFEAKAIAVFWLVVGYPADILFNLTRGTIMFRELPKELLFTSRVQRLVNSGSDWRREKAQRWAAFLNSVDPGHV